MEISNSTVLRYDEEKALKVLLDAFGSAFSLEDIVSAYCKANRNVDLAGEILYGSQGSSSIATHTYNSESSCVTSPEASSRNISSSFHAKGNPRASKQKWRPVSGGTISSVIGKDYVRPTPVPNGSFVTTKPLRLDSNEILMYDQWREESKMNSPMGDHLHTEMENFLCKMLGDGFQLSKDVIQQVLGNCGYDMQKSMQKLFDISDMNLTRRNNSDDESTTKLAYMCPKYEDFSRQRNFQGKNYSESNVKVNSDTNGADSYGQEKGKEILAALFSAPERPVELPNPTVRAARRTRAFGEIVVEPPKESVSEHKPALTMSYLKHDYMDDEDGSFHILRKAVKEYRSTMQEYYKAAVEAFAAGDYVRAGKLVEQGQFFQAKAREADEESNQKIFETRNIEAQSDLVIDLHECGAKEALRQLKSQLSLLSGIPTFQYLKVIIETDDEDVTKGMRKRRVMKLLEEEAITWTPDENVGTVLIHLDKINPKNLSFARK